jgi:hypothetical protein
MTDGEDRERTIEGQVGVGPGDARRAGAEGLGVDRADRPVDAETAEGAGAAGTGRVAEAGGVARVVDDVGAARVAEADGVVQGVENGGTARVAETAAAARGIENFGGAQVAEADGVARGVENGGTARVAEAGGVARGVGDGGTARVAEAGGVGDVARHAGEPRNQKLQRNVGELLQELRVAQAGVQILFGFLLSVVFTDRFHNASGLEKALHLCAVLLAVAATALLTAPAAWHRVLFRTGQREEILRLGNRLVVVGLACLAAAITATVALIAEVVYGLVVMVVVAVFALLLFGALWGLIPYWIRLDQASRE